MMSIVSRTCLAIVLTCGFAAASETPKQSIRRSTAPPPYPIVVRPDLDPAAKAVVPRAVTDGLTEYSIGAPTDEEQLYLELINRARANPVAESERFRDTTDPDVLDDYRGFGVDLLLMVSQFATIEPAPPVAMNANLIAAARRHSRDMMDNQFQRHRGSDGSEPFDRMQEAGYPWTAAGENIFKDALSVWHGHAAFQVDWGGDASTGGMQSPPGHRETIHDPIFREAGIGVVAGTGALADRHAVTQNFGNRRDLPSLITGVAYYDLNGNQFYDLGEGIGGVTVTANGSGFFARTAASGGYALPVPQDGSYTVTFSLANSIPGTGTETKTVVVSGRQNVKVDFVPAYHPPLVTGPASIGVNQTANFAITTVPGATQYQSTRSRRVSFAETEGAENGLADFTAITSPGYDVLDNAVRASGSFSFHLAHSEQTDQTLVWNRVFRPTGNSELVFASRLGWASTDQVARAQISTDGGTIWRDVWTQAGTNDQGERSFGRRTISLAPFDGESIQVRFVYDFRNGSYFDQTDPGVGLYLDDITVTHAEELIETTTVDLGAEQVFTFIAPEEAAYVFRARAQVGHAYLPWGPMKLVTIDTTSSVPAPAIVRIEAGDRLQITFESGATEASQHQLHSAASVRGPWQVEPAAVIEAVPATVNRFQASVARPGGSPRFYRIVRP